MIIKRKGTDNVSMFSTGGALLYYYSYFTLCCNVVECLSDASHHFWTGTLYCYWPSASKACVRKYWKILYWVGICIASLKCFSRGTFKKKKFLMCYKVILEVALYIFINLCSFKDGKLKGWMTLKKFCYLFMIGTSYLPKWCFKHWPWM